MEKNRKLIKLMIDLKEANEGLDVFFVTKIISNEQILLVFLLICGERKKLGYYSWNKENSEWENSL